MFMEFPGVCCYSAADHGWSHVSAAMQLINCHLEAVGKGSCGNTLTLIKDRHTGSVGDKWSTNGPWTCMYVRAQMEQVFLLAVSSGHWYHPSDVNYCSHSVFQISWCWEGRRCGWGCVQATFVLDNANEVKVPFCLTIRCVCACVRVCVW